MGLQIERAYGLKYMLGAFLGALVTGYGVHTGATSRIERLVDELSEYEGSAVRDVIREK